MVVVAPGLFQEDVTMRKSLLLAAGLLVALACPSVGADDKEKEPEIIAKLRKAKVEGPFTLAVLVKVKEGEEKALIKAAAPCIAATRKEKGCITYELNQDLDNPRQFVFYEKWKSIDALAEHLKTEHVKALLAALRDILDGSPRFHAFRPAD
jgi:quinol monooxygenase YgiN